MWVGPGRSAADLALLRSRGITHVLKRGGDVPNRRDEGIVYLRLDVGDIGSDACPVSYPKPRACGYLLRAITHDVRSFHPGQQQRRRVFARAHAFAASAL